MVIHSFSVLQPLLVVVKTVSVCGGAHEHSHTTYTYSEVRRKKSR
jgi:hypothetical protein